MSGGTVKYVSGDNLETSGGQTEGMIRKNALTDASDNMCSSVMIAKPHSSSDIHHHGEQDTVIYAVSGHGTVVSEGGKKRQDLKPGDFALVPAFTEHQEANDGDEEVKWVIVRSGRNPAVHNLKDWSTS